jgi:hypothetical protein
MEEKGATMKSERERQMEHRKKYGIKREGQDEMKTEERGKERKEETKRGKLEKTEWT